MNDFTITTRLTTKEYAKFVFTSLYKKPAFILVTLLGVYGVTTVILDYFKVINYYTDTPIFEILGGIFLLAGPSLLTFIAARQFASSPFLNHEMTYTFGEAGVTVQGLTFKSEFLWAHIIKQKESGKFLILYQTKKTGNFIDKSKLTAAQLAFIKSKIIQK